MDGYTVNDLSLTFSEKANEFNALKGLSFTWPSNKNIGIMGESGSGKSTLAKILLGLYKPTSGEVLFNGENINQWNANQWKIKRKIIQAVFQDTSGSLNNGLSVMRNMEEPMRNLTKLNKNQRKEIILDLMKKTNMDLSLLKRKTSHLSGGEQRKLSIIRALSVQPQFLILDEITAGLDVESKKEIIRTLKLFNEDRKNSYLLITHDIDFAKKTCDEIYIMKEGKFIQKGSMKGKYNV